jgi:hypothetical protein
MSKTDFEHTLSSGIKVNFVFNSDIPINYCYWDTVNTYQSYIKIKESNLSLSDMKFNIIYNISKNTTISNVTDNVETILKQYILRSNSEIFRQIPSADSQLPSWTSYNPQYKMFSFDSELFFKVKVDISSIRQCSYLTSPQQVSDDYQYANLSKNSNCSNKLITKNSINPTPCLFASGVFSAHFLTTCAGYQSDQKVIYTNTLTHKISNNVFNIDAVLYRTLENVYKVDIVNTTTNVVFSTLSYDSISFSKDKSNLYEEILTKLNHVLDSYKEDYNIETIYSYVESNINSVSVNIKSKNSYISSLLSKDSYVVQNNKVFQAI